MADKVMAFCILFAFVALMLFISYKGYKKSKARKDAANRTQTRLRATMNGTLTHISGLPVSKGVAVDVYCAPDKVVFKKGGQEIVVSRDKIVSADLVTTGNTTRKVLSGAAAGKYVAGKTGATLGALSALVPHLVISYESGGKRKQITLDTNSGGTFGAKLQKELSKGVSHERSTIEL